MEVTNQDIVQGLKAMQVHLGSCLVDELSELLCAHHTMPKLAIGETSYSLVYGSKAVPMKIGMEPTCVWMYDLKINLDQRMLELDLAEEKLLHVAVRIKAYLERVR